MPYLTAKQIKFIELYDGNAAEAARQAGYKGNDDTIRSAGSGNMQKPHIVAAIQERHKKKMRSRIATREDRQAFWTKVMNDENEKMIDRLRASELLGKSEADFIDKIQHSGEIKTLGMTPEETEQMFADEEAKKLGRQLALRIANQQEGNKK
ncbi:unnamed protein product [Sphagnum balticum]